MCAALLSGISPDLTHVSSCRKPYHYWIRHRSRILTRIMGQKTEHKIITCTSQYYSRNTTKTTILEISNLKQR